MTCLELVHLRALALRRLCVLHTVAPTVAAARKAEAALEVLASVLLALLGTRAGLGILRRSGDATNCALAGLLDRALGSAQQFAGKPSAP